MTAFSNPNANPNHNPNPNHISKTLTLSLSLSLTLTISLTRSRPLRMANYGRWWSGVVGGDFSQTAHPLRPERSVRSFSADWIDLV